MGSRITDIIDMQTKFALINIVPIYTYSVSNIICQLKYV